MNLWLRAFAVLWISCSLAAGQNRLEPAPGSDDAVVTVVRSGGFAGVHHKFRIYSDGRIANSKGTAHRIPVARLHSILNRITALDLPKSYEIGIPGTLCSDCFHYVITIRTESGKVVLRMDESQMGGQDALSKTAREIRDLVAAQKWK